MELADLFSSCYVYSLTREDGYSASADESLLMQNWKYFCFLFFCIPCSVIVIDS
jgi:hypothetical protein